jgi:ADP-ribose pyrophosphatase
MEPWPRLDEEVVYQGDRTLARRRYRQPDGRETTFDIILHGSGVSVLAFDEHGRVVLTRQFRPGPERVQFDLPSGFVDEGEEPVAAAARELAEETGYEGSLREVACLTPNAYSTEVRHVFVATDCRRAREPDTDDDEEIEVVLVTPERLRELLRSGEVTVVDAPYLALDVLDML